MWCLRLWVMWNFSWPLILELRAPYVSSNITLLSVEMGKRNACFVDWGVFKSLGRCFLCMHTTEMLSKVSLRTCTWYVCVATSVPWGRTAVSSRWIWTPLLFGQEPHIEVSSSTCGQRGEEDTGYVNSDSRSQLGPSVTLNRYANWFNTKLSGHLYVKQIQRWQSVAKRKHNSHTTQKCIQM